MSDREFAELLDALGPFETAPRLAVAVSGGPDSMALARLANRWARRRGGEVVGLVVDHGLRPESAAEAATVAGWLAGLGIACHALRWSGPKPASRLQERAREARYELLARACRELPALHLLLGHQREDQAETVAMRAARGSGEEGLAGMADIVELEGFRLLRPLLGVPRERLPATLRALGQPWLTDPSNAERRFARGALRADPAFDVDAAWREGEAAATARADRDRQLAAWLAAHARPHPFGFVRLDREPWRRLDPPFREAVLARAVLAVTGAPHPPARDALSRVAAALGTTAPATVSLAGCLAMAARDEIAVVREPGRIGAPMPLAAGSAVAWDRRFRLTCRASPLLLSLGALGESGRRALPPELRQRLRAAALPAAAVAALPALRHDGTLIGCPHLRPFGLAALPGVEIEAELRPARALAGATFGNAIVVSNDTPLIYRDSGRGEGRVERFCSDPRSTGA